MFSPLPMSDAGSFRELRWLGTQVVAPGYITLEFDQDKGCGIKGFLPTSVIHPLYEQNSLWEALSVVSQKWSFPTALNQDGSHVPFPRISSPFIDFTFLGSPCFPLARQKRQFFAGVLIPA